MIETPVVERYADGQTIITEGIVSTKAYIILEGKVKITKKRGDKNIVIGTLDKGDIFGEMGLIGEMGRTASVIALGDLNLGVIDKERFDLMLSHIPDDTRVVINALIDRLKMTTDKLAHFAVQLNNMNKAMHALSSKAVEIEGFNKDQ